jgi:MFS family permease
LWVFLIIGWFYSAPFYADAIAPAIGAIFIWQKDNLFWSENLILIFISISSFLFLPISLFLIRHLGRIPSEKNIFQGSITSGLFSTFFGIAMPFLSFLSILLINLGRLSGALICNAGRSGLISQKLREKPEEAGAIDTIFAPLGVALGALISGVIVGFLGYQFLFILGGIFVIIIGILMKKVAKFEKLR